MLIRTYVRYFLIFREADNGNRSWKEASCVRTSHIWDPGSCNRKSMFPSHFFGQRINLLAVEEYGHFMSQSTNKLRQIVYIYWYPRDQLSADIIHIEITVFDFMLQWVIRAYVVCLNHVYASLCTFGYTTHHAELFERPILNYESHTRGLCNVYNVPVPLRSNNRTTAKLM